MAETRSLAPWWLFLVTGILWIVFAWIVLRFDNASVAAVSILAGLVVLFAAASELAFRLRGTISRFTGRGAAAPGPAVP